MLQSSRFINRRQIYGAVTLVAALCSLPVLAQNYPAKPVRIVISFPPGGSVDFLGRIAAEDRARVQAELAARRPRGNVSLQCTCIGAQGEMFPAEIGLAARPAAIAATIMDGAVRRVHLGRIETNGAVRRFSMMVGVGFDAWVVARIDLRMKRLFGKGAYVATALAQLWRGVNTYYDVKADGVARRAASVVVANGRFYGGRFVIARAARTASSARWRTA